MAQAGSSCGGTPAVAAAGRRTFKLMLVDLDDTLYRVEALPKLVRSKIEEYMAQKLRMDPHESARLTSDLYITYGTTMAGLVALGYRLDYEDWWVPPSSFSCFEASFASLAERLLHHLLTLSSACHLYCLARTAMPGTTTCTAAWPTRSCCRRTR